MNLKSRFLRWYSDTFLKSSYADAMRNTVENSPWHREENVLVHTNMVVDEYIKLIGDREWTRNDYLGAFAAAFHDTGKPPKEEVVERDDGSTYRRYKGHENYSGRDWIDYSCDILNQLNSDFSKEEIYNVWVMIAYHLPYALRSDRVARIKNHLSLYDLNDTFINLLTADARGRISDNKEENLKRQSEWVDWYRGMKVSYGKGEGKQLVVLVGPTGSGKSTYIKNNFEKYGYHSMDDLRLTWYSSDYREAYDQSKDDKSFNDNVMKHFHQLMKDDSFDTVIVDNTSLTNKARRRYLTKDAESIAVVFLSSYEENLKRLRERNKKADNNKVIPEFVLKRMYFQVQPPLIGEFDRIEIVLS